MGRRLAVLAPLLAALALAACGEDSRDRAEGYVERSNDVLRDAADDFAAANQAYAAFRDGRIDGRLAVEQLGEARDDILFARGELAALDAPPEVGGLREALLTFFDANGRLATETADLAVYLPAAQDALEPLEPAGERLGDRLEGDARPQRQQRALSRYADALDRIVDDLDDLEPPPVLEPTHDTQVQRLDAAGQAARGLRGAIGDQDAAAIAQRLLRFRELGSNDEGDGLLESAAVRSYVMRIDGVEQARATLEDERRRLEESLG
ncbi:MAG: hypothetical protein MSC31_02740 [Solirubrobacteraceae bacterium MAG38_C4-C5]|nr:hypothetical protein [Candidatus Siliceabacter maunaloa]